MIQSRYKLLLFIQFMFIISLKCQIDFDEDPYFEIKFLTKEQINLISDISRENKVTMKSKDSFYDCYIPELKEKDSTQQDQQNISLKLEPFLKFLTTNCLIRMDGWWNYEFCFNKHIIQFHMEKDKIEKQIILGKYDQSKSNLEVKVDDKFVSQLYYNGTACDIENLVRETEIRYYCSQNTNKNLIRSIEEPSTCRYIVNVEISDLCFHPLFAKKGEASIIYCEKKD
eukprot:TRINITY_DN6042_c0_g1_i1.p1 TRINITY_DN6042_c0_g1~~TRINITY_DN6042_c0_g1_i1.p1  ORF type:complete len:227 (-),score=43.39 TRINITY_DN6042_c0_g1_i1:80-760(-)